MASGIRFTYQGDPAGNDVDAVRFHLGDTNPERPLLDDREVAFAIVQYPDLLLAAASLADHLSGKFIAEGDIKVGPVSKSFSKVAELYRQKAADLRHQAGTFAGVSFPATIIAERDTLDLDNTLTRPQFRVGQFDNPFAVQLSDQLDRHQFHGF